VGDVLTASLAECVTWQKIFFTFKFSYLLFSNPTHETGTANRSGNTDTKPRGVTSQYDGPTRNTEQQSGQIYYTLLCVCTMFLLCL
jgi:hypothetical protein